MTTLQAKRSIDTGPHNHLESAYEWPLIKMGSATLGIDDIATPKSLRFIDCKAFCNHGILRIWQSPDIDILNLLPYAAISYVWKGNHQSPLSSSFAVEGAEDGDRISLDVLRIVCEFALHKRAHYVWLDRVSIMQKHKADKNWQIMNMATIYRRCRICIALPGGIGGFVDADEQTSWIDRSWTLQEALLPAEVICLIRWDLGSGWLQNSNENHIVEVFEVDGILQLPLIHALCVGTRPCFSSTYSGGGEDVWIDVEWSFLAHQTSQLLELEVALRQGGIERETAVWRCALTRTSKRDIDVIYSIMGFFNVQLNPSLYQSRQEAAIALVQNIMANGGRASWFAASMTSPISSVLCTMPPMPVSAAQGTPSIQFENGQLVNANSVIKGVDWYLRDPPMGTVDDLGFVEFTAPISPVLINCPNPSVAAGIITAGERTGKVYVTGIPSTHAVVIGATELYSLVTVPKRVWEETALLMLIEPHTGGDGWHKTGMARVSPNMIEGWQPRKVRIGRFPR